MSLSCSNRKCPAFGAPVDSKAAQRYLGKTLKCSNCGSPLKTTKNGGIDLNGIQIGNLDKSVWKKMGY